jgi:hypothetical protein
MPVKKTTPALLDTASKGELKVVGSRAIWPPPAEVPPLLELDEPPVLEPLVDELPLVEEVVVVATPVEPELLLEDEDPEEVPVPHWQAPVLVSQPTLPHWVGSCEQSLRVSQKPGVPSETLQ